jgi:hypothetical protein
MERLILLYEGLQFAESLLQPDLDLLKGPETLLEKLLCGQELDESMVHSFVALVIPKVL